MATKYEKLEAEYNQLSTPEQQWAWVLAHKDEVILKFDNGYCFFSHKQNSEKTMGYIDVNSSYFGSLLNVLSVLGIEVEEV